MECFRSPAELLEKYRAGERYDVLFLDIVMEPINGINLAGRIRNYDRRALIVFLTCYLEYAPAGYEVNAFRYLLKPVTEEAFVRIMKEIRQELEAAHTLLIRTPECELLIHTAELHYLEANNKESTLYYMRDTVTLRRSLSDLEKELPPAFFFRIHRKYLVNLSRVREFDEKSLTLDCGKTLPISRRRSGGFRCALNHYIEGDLRE